MSSPPSDPANPTPASPAEPAAPTPQETTPHQAAADAPPTATQVPQAGAPQTAAQPEADYSPTSATPSPTATQVPLASPPPYPQEAYPSTPTYAAAPTYQSGAPAYQPQPYAPGAFHQEAGPQSSSPPAAGMDVRSVNRLAGIVVILAGWSGFMASLLALYTVKINFPELDGELAEELGADAPSGGIEIGLGFYDTVPYSAPLIALVVPIFALLAGLTAWPAVLRPQRRPSGVPALFAVAATLSAVLVMLTNPLPDVTLTGDLADSFQDEFDIDLNEVLGEVLSISPGLGLILSLVFGVIASVAAGFLFANSLRETTPTPPVAALPPAPTGPAPVYPAQAYEPSYTTGAYPVVQQQQQQY